jgi:hypothetical protein
MELEVNKHDIPNDPDGDMTSLIAKYLSVVSCSGGIEMDAYHVQ